MTETLKFVCGYQFVQNAKCGKPAPYWYYILNKDGDVKPLCNKHAAEYVENSLRIDHWDE